MHWINCGGILVNIVTMEGKICIHVTLEFQNKGIVCDSTHTF